MNFSGLILAILLCAACALFGYCFGYCFGVTKHILILREKGWTILPPEEETDAE